MEEFTGQWEGVATDGPELDAFLAANGLTANKAIYLKKNIYSVKVDGDTVTSVMTREGIEPVHQSAQLGKRTETAFPDIGKGFVTLTKEGKYLVSKQEVGGSTFTNKCCVNGNELILETSGNGKAITTLMKKR